MNWNGRITEKRKQLGMSKAELARRVGVSGPTVTDWENEEIKTLAGKNLLKAAEVLQVTPEWLLTGKGGQHQPLQARQEPATYSINPELNEAWNLLLPDEQAALLADIKSRAAHNRAVMAMMSGKPQQISQPNNETQSDTVRASERGHPTKWFGQPTSRSSKEREDGKG